MQKRGTCGVGAGDVGGEVYHGRQSAHVDAVSWFGYYSGIVQRVENGCDEPREDVHERVDEEIDAAQLARVAKLDATATQRSLDLCATGREGGRLGRFWDKTDRRTP